MEPRISSLLEDSLTDAADHTGLDYHTSLPSASVCAASFPQPLSPLANPFTSALPSHFHPASLYAYESGYAHRQGSDQTFPSGASFAESNRLATHRGRENYERHHNPSEVRPAKSSVPLAEVLNDGTSTKPSTTGISLSNILHRSDGAGHILSIPRTEQPHGREHEPNAIPRKRKRMEQSHPLPESFTLPKPPPLARKGVRRQRIPPLLQGLHQPPPNAGLFPPITAEAFKGVTTETGSKAHEPFDGGPEGDAAHQDSEPRAEWDRSDGTDLADGSSRAPEHHGPCAGDDPPRAQDVVLSEKTTAANAVSGRQRTTVPHKKRRKWTDRETAHLLRGVARFGIGRWKKIVAHPDYEFHGRTAVDLKDRFRTCCPDEYRQFRSASADMTRPAAAPEASDLPRAVSPSQADSGPAAPSASTATVHPNSTKSTLSHRKTPSDLARLGIDRPFPKPDRRSRREFSSVEDEALLAGFRTHGASWHVIRKEAGEILARRNPTDLRDRFRNAFPTQYEQAGHKVKPRKGKPAGPHGREDIDRGPDGAINAEGRRAREGMATRPADSGAMRHDGTYAMSSSMTGSNGTDHYARSCSPPPGVPSTQLGPISGSRIASAWKPLPLDMKDWFTDDFGFGSDDNGSSSPITLDRSIVDWATNQMTAALSGSMASSQPPSQLPEPGGGSLSGPTIAPPSMMTSADREHVNPLDTVTSTGGRIAGVPSQIFPSSTPPTLPVSSQAISASASWSLHQPPTDHPTGLVSARISSCSAPPLMNLSLPSISVWPSGGAPMSTGRPNMPGISLPRPAELLQLADTDAYGTSRE